MTDEENNKPEKQPDKDPYDELLSGETEEDPAIQSLNKKLDETLNLTINQQTASKIAYFSAIILLVGIIIISFSLFTSALAPEETDGSVPTGFDDFVVPDGTEAQITEINRVNDRVVVHAEHPEQEQTILLELDDVQVPPPNPADVDTDRYTGISNTEENRICLSEQAQAIEEWQHLEQNQTLIIGDFHDLTVNQDPWEQYGNTNEVTTGRVFLTTERESDEVLESTLPLPLGEQIIIQGHGIADEQAVENYNQPYEEAQQSAQVQENGVWSCL